MDYFGLGMIFIPVTMLERRSRMRIPTPQTSFRARHLLKFIRTKAAKCLKRQMWVKPVQYCGNVIALTPHEKK